MTWYKCCLCEYTTEYRQNLTRHEKSVHANDKVKKSSWCRDASSASKPWGCECGKAFRWQAGLCRHKRQCPGVKQPAVTNNINPVTHGHHNTVNACAGDIIHNHHVTINITPFSKHKLYQMTDTQFMEMMKKGVTQAVMDVIQEHHFNSNKPQYMNCYISNLKDKIGRKYESEGWQVCDATKLASDIIEKVKDTIDTLVDVENPTSKLSRCVEKWERHANNEEFDSHIHKEAQYLLYNKKDLVRSTHKLGRY